MTNFHYNPDIVLPILTSDTWLERALARDPVRSVVAVILLNGVDVPYYIGINYLPEGALTRDGVPRELVRVMAVHAEKDAIIQALKHHDYTELEGATMYVSLEPCVDCRNLMKLFKISDCYFSDYYVPSDSGASK